MSRVAKKPVALPKGVEINESGGDLTVKGPKGELNMRLNSEVVVTIDTEAASARFHSSGHVRRSGPARIRRGHMV